MTPEQPPEPFVFSAPSDPNRGRTALAFVLAAIVLVSMALGYRSLGRSSRAAESGISHCYQGDYLATLALSTYSVDSKATGKLWRDAVIEYFEAIKINPRMARARRGIAAIKWLQGNRVAARRYVTAQVDVPPMRNDTWLATQAAYGAIPAPTDPAVLARYKQALDSRDLGWSRFVARQALSGTEAERRRIIDEMRAAGEARRTVRRTRVLLGLLSFTVGIGVLLAFLASPERNRLAGLQVPGGVLVSAFLVGMVVENLPGVPMRLLFGRFLDAAHDNVYFLSVLLTHLIGLLLAAVCAQAILRRRGASLRALGWDAARAPMWAVGAYLGLMPVLFMAEAVSRAAANLFPDVETPLNSAAWMAASAHGWSLVAVFLTVCVVGPLAEELLFRGLLMRGLISSFGFWGAAVLSSTTFAALHPQLPLGFLPIWCIGMALCVVYRRSGSLTACWALHGLNNAVALVTTLSVSAHMRLF